jgi:hypothetical protein
MQMYTIPMPDLPKSKKSVWLALTVFATGLLVGTLFFTLALWAQIEASQFEPPPGGDNPLGSLSCPIFVTPSQPVEASAWLENPTERPMRRLAFTRISEGSVLLVREIETRIELQPGENHQMIWPMTVEDAAWDRFVFLRVNVLRNTPMLSQTGACGVMVVNLPLITGGQLTGLLLAITVVGLVGGMVLWWRMHQPMIGTAAKIQSTMLAYSVLIAAGVFTSLTGRWIFGALLLATLLLFTTTIIARLLLNERKWQEVRAELYGE